MARPFFRRPPVALLIILVLAGFLLVITGTATSAANRSSEPRRQAIIEQILDRRSAVADLDDRVLAANQRVTDANDAAGQASAQRNAENQRQEQLALEAGTVAVRGSGLVVTVSDAPDRSGGAAFDANRIQDNDLQLLVNALFAAGAEAIAINDNRVVAVTPIRAAGGTIVVNYRPVNSPYRIVAIGADRDAFVRSDKSRQFAQWKEKYSLGFSVDRSRNLSAPAYSGRVGIDLARAVTSTTAAPSGTTSSSARANRGR